MGLIDSALSVVPPAYRKEASLVAFGIVLAGAYYGFDARITTAETAAKAQPALKQQVDDVQGKLGVVAQQTSDIAANVALITAALLGRSAVAGHVSTAAPSKAPSP